MSTLQVADNTYILDFRHRIFDVRVDGGSLILNEVVPSDGKRPVNLELTLDPEMLNVLLKRIAANEPLGSQKIESVQGYCTICGRTAQQEAGGLWEHLEFSCESPKAKFTVQKPEVVNPNDIKVALQDLLGKVKPLRPAMSPTLRSFMDKVDEWTKS